MNAGEYGIAFNLNVNYDISGFTTLSLAFTRPDGTSFTGTGADVSVPTVALVTTDQGTFAAKQYCVYVFKANDISAAGSYTVRLTYTDASKSLKSDKATFTVNP